MKLLECVPNVSEGRDKLKISLLAGAIESVENVKLLHQDTGYAANRTVFTFAGPPHAVIQAAFELYKVAWKLVSMPDHQGTHPRQGAVDVCPLVPLQGMTIEEAKPYATQLAALLDKELGIPGYFYEFSATSSARSNLALLRKGEFEALPGKLDRLPPDFGNAQLWQANGVTVLGVRKLLVAYNVNLNTDDVSLAQNIARKVRGSGYVFKDPEGIKQRQSGKLRSVKGIGWYIADFDKVQVSYNLTDLDVNGILDVFLHTQKEADKQGCRVTGSELVGLAPLSEFMKVQKYLSKMDLPNTLNDAIQYLGLHEISSFEPKQKIIEYLLERA